MVYYRKLECDHFQATEAQIGQYVASMLELALWTIKLHFPAGQYNLN